MLKVLSVYLLSLIAGFAYGVFRRLNNQKKTKGIITDLKQKIRNESGRTTYTGVVNYSIDGREYQIESSFQASSYRIGKKVIVYYNEVNPREAFVRAPIIVYLFVYFLILLGTYLLINEAIITFNRG